VSDVVTCVSLHSTTDNAAREHREW